MIGGSWETFDFSAEQWARIELIVAEKLGRSLSQDEKREIRDIGATYSIDGAGIAKSSADDLTKVWNAVDRQSKALADSLETLLAFFRTVQAPAQITEALAVLESLRATAADAADRAATFYSIQPKKKKLLYGATFEMWANCLGGSLAVTTDPVTNEIRAPVIDFVEAITGPLLGAEALSRARLKELAREQREMRDGCR